MRILVVEDDTQLGETLVAALALEGYAVDWLRRGDAVAAAVAAGHFDALLLDIGLPGSSGLAILRALRARGDDLPVLLLTARDTPAERVAGLDMGADDYLGKPFDMEELCARLRSLLRRRAGAAGRLLVVGDLEIDLQGRSARHRGEPLALTAREFAVLELLARHRGRFVSRRQLEEGIYSWGEEIGSNTVEVFVSRLRKLLGTESIATLRNVGYRLTL